jgi:hypothetical protein
MRGCSGADGGTREPGKRSRGILGNDLMIDRVTKLPADHFIWLRPAPLTLHTPPPRDAFFLPPRPGGSLLLMYAALDGWREPRLSSAPANKGVSHLSGFLVRTPPAPWLFIRLFIIAARDGSHTGLIMAGPSTETSYKTFDVIKHRTSSSLPLIHFTELYTGIIKWFVL